MGCCRKWFHLLLRNIGGFLGRTCRRDRRRMAGCLVGIGWGWGLIVEADCDDFLRGIRRFRARVYCIALGVNWAGYTKPQAAFAH